MGRRKAGMCKCGHELRRFHDDAGVCTYGAGALHGARCAVDYGGPCSKPRKGKAMKTTRAVTVNGDALIKALDAVIHAFGVLRAELVRGKDSEGGATMPAVLGESPAASPARGQSKMNNGAATVDTKTMSSRVDGAASDGELGAGPLALLVAIAQWGNPTSEVLVIATGYRATSVQTYLGELSQRALITREHGRAQITSDGVALLACVGPVPAKPAKAWLLDRWLGEFDEGPATILRAIAMAEGATVTPSDLLRLTKYKATSIQTYLGELSTPHVIKRGGGLAWLHPELGGPQ